ncbi:MAG: hypothetical protein ACWA5X_05710 [bacterium]
MKLDVSPFDSLSQAIAAAEAAIDEAIGRERLRYLTEVPGQQATYDAKYADALAWLRYFEEMGSEPAPGAYRWVAREAFYTSASELETATLIATTGDLWNQTLGPELEGIRVGLKKAVRAGATVAEVAVQRKAAIGLISGALD